MNAGELREIAEQATALARRVRAAIDGAPPGRFRDTGLLSVQLNAAHLAAWADLAATWADDPPGTPLSGEAGAQAPPSTRRWAGPP